jgi:Ser/Thr protein kinase RdoA (MazF antagonist)
MDRWCVIMDRVDGSAFAEAGRRDPDWLPAYLAEMVRLHRLVHGCPGRGLGSMKARLQANIRATTNLGEARQRPILDGLATLPEGDRLCHGDFHPWNIMGSPGQPILVDWVDACCGEPAADVAGPMLMRRISRLGVGLCRSCGGFSGKPRAATGGCHSWRQRAWLKMPDEVDSDGDD